MSEIDPGRPAQYVGARVLRVEDPRFLRGKAKYIDDISVPGMLHAAFLRSTEPHARLARIDTSRAEQLEGVVRVFTGADLKDEVGLFVTALPLRTEVNETSRHVLPIDKVRHVGEAIAVVVAESRYVAEDGCDLIDVEYEPLPAVLDAEEALKPDAPVLDEALGQNNIAHIEERYGDVDRAFAEADHVFTKRFHHGRYSGVPLEGRGVIAEYESGRGEFTIWSSTQIPHFLKTKVAGPLGVSEAKIRVIAPAVGGGFGVKAHMFVEEAIIPALARILERPVKWVEDRYEHLAASAHSKEEIIYIDIATTADGTFVGFKGHYITDGGAYSCVPYSPLIDSLTSAGLLPSHYDVRDVSFEVDAPLTNKCMIGSYRGVGWTSGHTARECLIDDIADELGIDPVELRVMNTIPSEPYKSATGLEYDGGSYIESMRKAQELVGYAEFRTRQSDLRKEGRYVGVGFSPYVEPTGFGTRIAQASGWPVVYFDSSTRGDRVGRVRDHPCGAPVAWPGSRDESRPGRRRPARRAARVREARPRRHRDDRIRDGDLREPQRGRLRRCHHSRRAGRPREAGQAGGRDARSERRGHRALRRAGAREGSAWQGRVDRGHRRFRLLGSRVREISISIPS